MEGGGGRGGGVFGFVGCELVAGEEEGEERLGTWIVDEGVSLVGVEFREEGKGGEGVEL